MLGPRPSLLTRPFVQPYPQASTKKKKMFVNYMWLISYVVGKLHVATYYSAFSYNLTSCSLHVQK